MATITLITTIVGTRHKGPRAIAAVLQLYPGDHVRLVREPDNPHDPNAVCCHVRGLRVGYLPKEIAPTIAAAMDSRINVAAVVSERADGSSGRLIRGPSLSITWEETAPPPVVSSKETV